MHLETVSKFKIMQSKKDIGYTYFRFEKNAHKELVDRPVAAFNIDGAYLLVPLSKSKNRSRVITEESINQRLNEVVKAIRDSSRVITAKSEHSGDKPKKTAPGGRFELPRRDAPAAFKAAAFPD